MDHFPSGGRAKEAAGGSCGGRGKKRGTSWIEQSLFMEGQSPKTTGTLSCKESLYEGAKKKTPGGKTGKKRVGKLLLIKSGEA